MHVNIATLLLAATSVVASSVQGDRAFLGIKGQAFNVHGLTPDGQDFFQLKNALADDKLPSKGLSSDDIIIVGDGDIDLGFGVDNIIAELETDDSEESETDGSGSGSEASSDDCK